VNWKQNPDGMVTQEQVNIVYTARIIGMDGSCGLFQWMYVFNCVYMCE